MGGTDNEVVDSESLIPEQQLPKTRDVRPSVSMTDAFRMMSSDFPMAYKFITNNCYKTTW